VPQAKSEILALLEQDPLTLTGPQVEAIKAYLAEVVSQFRIERTEHIAAKAAENVKAPRDANKYQTVDSVCI